jgi:hypothetical protein
MALAMIYPEPEKLKRAGSSVSEQQEIGKGRLSMARTVLGYSRELAEAVLADETTPNPMFLPSQNGMSSGSLTT